MRKFTHILFGILAFMLFAIPASSQNVNVTFRVDMQEQTTNPAGVHIAGSFQGWNPGSTAMSNLIADIWEYTTQLASGSTIEYKFVNGDTWGQDEYVTGPCSPGNGNRILTIPDSDVILANVCFGECFPCVLPTVDITLQVDMSNEDIDPLGVFVQGSFQDPVWTSQAMTDMGNDLYAITVPMEMGTFHEYKFLNGTSYETVPPSCGFGGYSNRSLTVPDVNTTIPVVCFSSCDPCSSVTDIDVTFRVDMSNEIVAPEGVHIAGGFQGWDPAATVMTDVGSGVWEYTTTLQSLSYHEYKFINGITFDDAETVPWYCNNNSTGNRFVNVPESNLILDPVCFGSCLVCNPDPVTVTFRVDMSLVLISQDGVHLAGSFQNWDEGNLIPMSDIGNDIYEASVILGEGEFHEYKFINGNSLLDAENINGSCGNFSGNREFFVPSANIELDTDCFEQCGSCVADVYTVNLKVLLEGPESGGVMNKDLYNAGVVPINQPYNTAPWNYSGTEHFDLGPTADIVDWVLLEFRDAGGGPDFATSDRMIYRKAALLKSDGTIVKTDGVTPLTFTGYIQYDMYVVIYHRNHLPVMSANWIDLESGSIDYDFTTEPGSAYNNGQKDLGDGYYGMFAGDCDANGIIDSNDKDINWSNNAGQKGYLNSDLNMDSEVNNPDKVEHWEPNLGATSTIPQ